MPAPKSKRPLDTLGKAWAAAPVRHAERPIKDKKGHKRRIAEYLRTSGPVWGDQAAQDLGLTPSQWWSAVGKCHWFTFWPAKGTNKVGWRLTKRGLRECFPEAAKAA